MQRTQWTITAAVLLFCTAGAPAAPPQTAPAATRPADVDGPAFTVTRFDLDYTKPHPQHPGLTPLTEAPIRLGLTDTGYVAPRDGAEPVTLRLADVPGLERQTFHASAILAINQAVAARLTEAGLLGVFVAPDPADVSPRGEDLREDGDTSFGLRVTTSVATSIRSVASGERFTDDTENLDAHRRIRERSPVKPRQAKPKTIEGPPPRRDLLRMDVLEDYAFRLNRHPGRRVDVAVTAVEDEEGEAGVELEYLVYERRPWRLYANAANTGTEQTADWRETFGFSHEQLTGNDDILALTYSTANFDASHAFIASYNAPIGRLERWRWAVDGLYSEYTASDVGLPGADFTGESWGVGGELIYNAYQDRDLFIDLYGGLRYEDLRVDNELAAIVGEEQIVTARAGARAERVTDTDAFFALLGTRWALPGLTDVDEGELDELGRPDVDRSWWLVEGSASYLFYLEPLVNRAAWEDPATPASSTLAHEVALSLRGQWVPGGRRLIPQVQQTAGGFYTVRGYPESTVAGDTVVIGSAEYRYHLPRAFGVRPEPERVFNQHFRFAPQQVYGRPDWDLVLRVFVDAAFVHANDALSFESDQTLVGTGVGFEVSVLEHVNVRLDWGFALTDVEEEGVEAGDSRLHVAATISF